MMMMMMNTTYGQLLWFNWYVKYLPWTKKHINFFWYLCCDFCYFFFLNRKCRRRGSIGLVLERPEIRNIILFLRLNIKIFPVLNISTHHYCLLIRIENELINEESDDVISNGMFDGTVDGYVRRARKSGTNQIGGHNFLCICISRMWTQLFMYMYS